MITGCKRILFLNCFRIMILKYLRTYMGMKL